MEMFRRRVALLAAFAMCSATSAVAQDGAGQTSATAMPGAAETTFGSAKPMAESDLGKVAGREDTGAMVASATQRNTVSNNSVTGRSTTGGVQIAGNAFQNLQGLAVISANSGNNVAINSSMNVVVNLAPR